MTTNTDIESIGIVGGGLMGSGIAEVAARAGLTTIVREPEEYLEAARTRVARSLTSAVKRGKVTAAESDAAMARISFTTALADLGACEVVVEAVPEKLELKQAVFAELDPGLRIGLDVTYEVCNSLFEELKDPAYAPPPLLQRMLAAGYRGRKSGQGFYTYD